MAELNYTTLEDITEFLKTFNITWLGKIDYNGTEKTATINDFGGITTLKSYKEYPSKKNYTKTKIFVSDRIFSFIEDASNTIHDHSVRWQAFMIYRKDKDYAKYVYDKCVEEQKEKEKNYNERINLVKKLEQNLQYEKSIEMARYNTTILNATCKLYDFEIREIDTLVNKNVEDLNILNIDN